MEGGKERRKREGEQVGERVPQMAVGFKKNVMDQRSSLFEMGKKGYWKV